jgi:secreted trypsin-like serine protease
MKTPALLFSFCLATAACGSMDETGQDPIGDEDDSIVGGTTDNADPAVNLIFIHQPAATSGFICSGTIVGPSTILTAAHCVDPASVGPGNTWDILPGTIPDGSVRLATTDVDWDRAFNVNNLGAGHDIGVIHLAAPSTVAPLAINRSHTLGTGSVRIVGYGTNTHQNTGSGTKRTATTSITAQSNILVQIGTSNRQTCHGDSGGPAFQTIGGQSVIIGVTSFGSDRATTVCFGGGVDTRVDAYLPFLDARIR